MDENGGLSIRNWGYYDLPPKSNLGLHLRSSMPSELNTKPFFSNSGFVHRGCGVADPPMQLEFARDSWFNHRDNRFLNVLPTNSTVSTYPVPQAAMAVQTLQMRQHPVLPKDESPEAIVKDVPLKKRPPTPRLPKAKKPKKASSPDYEPTRTPVSRGRPGTKSTHVMINGMDLDITEIPTPVCSCTGAPQQCYRWGAGGWQSACCTNGISIYPLPMNTKRRGARIAGRKMSHGAFKKVLEKIVGEGYNLSNPIDLRTHWARHGTNKFVTIR